MTYVAAEARQELLGALAAAIDVVGQALVDLGSAYELLDETTGDRLEADVFRPAQQAYGKAKQTHAAFAARHGLAPGTLVPGTPGAPSHGARGLIDSATDRAAEADHALTTLQESDPMLEVGDAELRAGIADVRTRLDGVRIAARGFVRTLGR